MIMAKNSEISVLENGNLCISVPVTVKHKQGRKIIIAPGGFDGEASGSGNPINESLALMIARGHIWMKMLEEGKLTNIYELAEKTGYHRTHVWRILMMANLSPSITEAVFNGTEPDKLSMQKLKRPIPEDWQEQKESLK